jgi:hypothetical protein
MDCKHERLRCTNNEFFCLLCGKHLPYNNSFNGGKEIQLPPIKVCEQKKPAEAPKTARKRKTVKADK